MAKISDSLRETVAENEHIQEVHFSKKGHYFNVHKHGDKMYGRLTKVVKHEEDKAGNSRNKWVDAPVPETEIIETVSREVILKEDKPVKGANAKDGDTTDGTAGKS